MIALIAIITFLLLARAFRSLLLPLKAILLNILSVAAAWGVLVLVWQHGYGSELIWGIDATGSIPSWMPLMVFAFLFGLSMDYEVFILARMREEYDRTGSTETAVVQGIGRTGRLVTSAALILFLAFASMASGPETDVKMIATGAGGGDPHRRDDHPRADRARRDLADGPLELVAAALVGADPARGAVARLARAGEVRLDEAVPLRLVLAPALLGPGPLPVAGDRDGLARDRRARRAGGGGRRGRRSPRRGRRRGRRRAGNSSARSASASVPSSPPCSQVTCRSPGDSSGSSSSGPSTWSSTWTGRPAGMRASEAAMAGTTLASPTSRCQSASGSGA